MREYAYLLNDKSSHTMDNENKGYLVSGLGIPHAICIIYAMLTFPKFKSSF